MTRLLLPLIPLALAACASTSPAGDNVAQNDGLLCERATETGSMISKTRCSTAAQREAEQAAVGKLGKSSMTTPVTGTSN